MLFPAFVVYMFSNMMEVQQLLANVLMLSDVILVFTRDIDLMLQKEFSANDTHLRFCALMKDAKMERIVSIQAFDV